MGHKIFSNLISSLIIILFFTQTFMAQSLIIQAEAGLTNHYANMSEDKKQDEQVVPSIGVFFDDDLIIGGSIRYSFLNIKEKRGSFFTGLGYEYSSLPPKNNGSILGKHLELNNLALILGYWVKPFNSAENIILFIETAYLIKNYKGFFSTKDDIYRRYYDLIDLSYKSKYNSARAIRLGTSLVYSDIFKLPVALGLAVSYEIGTVKRDRIEVYYKNILEGELIPTGDIVLPDNVFNLKLTISYLLNL